MSFNVIADVTKAYPNTVQPALDAIQSFCSTNGIPAANITLVARPDHASVQDVFPPPSSWVTAPTPRDAPAVVDQILQRLSGQPLRVVLVSFNPDVWRLSKKYWPGMQVTARHVFESLSVAPSAAPTSRLGTMMMEGPEPTWTFDHVSTLDEALTTLVGVLTKQGAFSPQRSLRQTSLRPWMGMVNPLRFTGNAASTRSSGMIGILVRIAAIRGIIGVSGSEPSDLSMWLISSANRSIATQGQSQLSNVQQGAAAPEELPNVVTPADANAGRQLEPKNLRREKRVREPDKYPCDRMSTSIEGQKMGPFPTARPVVYQSLDNCARSNAKLSFRSFVEAALESAKAQMVNSTQPWTAIRFTTERQLLRSGAVLDERGKSLPDHWSSGNLIVHRLAPDWVRRAEGEILLALFAVQEVTGDQLVDIARSVWGSSSAEAISKVQGVLQLLIDAGRVQEDDRGVFRVKRASSSEQTVSSLPSANESQTSQSDQEINPVGASDGAVQ